MLEEQNNGFYNISQDPQTEVDAFSHIKKHQYANKVFCWLEQGNTPNIIKFYNTFPHLINELYTPNHWNPLMYAVRYGNRELIQFLFEKGMKTTIPGIYNHVSIIHSAVYSGEVQILLYVLTSIYRNANPSNCQTSPLKIAMKTGNPKMVQLLIAKGAYYTFGDVLNNLSPKESSSQQLNRYITMDSGKQISNALVVEDTTIKDCPIKQTLRWARIRQTMFMRHFAQKGRQIREQYGDSNKDQIKSKIKEEQADQDEQKMDQQSPINQKSQLGIEKYKILNQKHKFFGLAQILLNDDYYDNILKVLVGKGDSILIKSDPIQQKQSAKQAPSSQTSAKK